MSSRYNVHPMEENFRQWDKQRRQLDAQLEADWEAVAAEGHLSVRAIFKRAYHLGATYGRNLGKPVAHVAEVHMSRYTVEWTNGPLPEGTALYAAADAALHTAGAAGPLGDPDVLDSPST
jgi:hypothetical protein